MCVCVILLNVCVNVYALMPAVVFVNMLKQRLVFVCAYLYLYIWNCISASRAKDDIYEVTLGRALGEEYRDQADAGRQR